MASPLLRVLVRRILRFASLVHGLGLPGAIAYVAACRRDSVRRSPYRLFSKRLAYPVWIRPRTSDLDVFRLICVDNEYACLKDMEEAEVIVDCGANIGLSAAYFLTRCPLCVVYSLEPDPGNFCMLDRNVAAYGRRCVKLMQAVWSTTADRLVIMCDYRDGRDWSRRVVPTLCQFGECVEAVTLDDLIGEMQGKRVSLLKIDVEGAEKEIFRGSRARWLTLVDRIAIELHDEEAEQLFHAAMPDDEWLKSRHGELTVAIRRSLRAPMN